MESKHQNILWSCDFDLRPFLFDLPPLFVFFGCHLAAKVLDYLRITAVSSHPLPDAPLSFRHAPSSVLREPVRDSDWLASECRVDQ